MLEPEIAQYVAFCEQYEVPLGFETVALQRERYNEMRAKLAEPLPEAVVTEDALVKAEAGHQIPIRIYRTTTEANQPCCLFMHGGGFVVGNIQTHHDWIGELADLSGVSIVSVDYRLSPEVTYPAALHDVRDVLLDMVKRASEYQIDTERIAVSGDSAGGNLAAAICLLSRDKEMPPLSSQLLIYPGLGASHASASYEAHANAPLLKTSELSFYLEAYLGHTEPDKYALPLLEQDFSRLPPAFILTVEHDPIRDDGILYAKRLRGAGVAVEHYDAPGLVHGCMQARRTSPETRKAFDAWANALKDFSR